MTLIIGGAGQGKLDYVLQKTGYDPGQVAHDPEGAKNLPIFDGLENWPGLDENELRAANPDVILICDEVGCGVVPLDREDRAWREKVGRVCCRLAEKAAAVYRVTCGLGARLK